MVESIPADIAAELKRSDRGAYLEQRLFVFSPVNTFWTSLLIFTVLIGSFAVTAMLSGIQLFVSDAHQVRLSATARFAVTFSLLITTVLGMQRFSRVRERSDLMAHAAVLKGGIADACEVTALTPGSAKLRHANLIGVTVGILLCWTIVRPTPALQTIATYAWFCVVTIVVSVLFARGVALTRGAGRDTRRNIENKLIVDLLRVDRLSVIGRSAARAALIWFTISAVICLFFIGGGIDPFTITLLIGCAAMGIWIFVATMEMVRRKIRVAKAAELERVRTEIEVARHDPSDHLQGLLAYEARIQAVHEWPFDQTTLVRVGASAFILAVPWFGQAIVQYFIERMGQK
ncbi:MAG: hypothetical protein WDM89_08830 [Rhizomicrobium sp.]